MRPPPVSRACRHGYSPGQSTLTKEDGVYIGLGTLLIIIIVLAILL